MPEKRSVKQLEAELKDLKLKLNLIKSTIRKSSSLSELENLRALLLHVEKLIDLNIRRTMEMRLDHRIEVSEKIESAISISLRKMHLDRKASQLGVSLLHRGWTESLKRNRIARQNEQKAILDELYEEVREIRRVLEALGQQFYPILTRDIPASIAPTHPSAIRGHKGRKPGPWTQALDACINGLGVEVEYQAAAAWLDWNRSSIALDFAAKYGASPAKNGGPPLRPTIKTNPKARQQFHKDLNAAKQRIRGKKRKN